MRRQKYRIWHIKRKVMLIAYNLAFTDEGDEPLACESVQVRLDDEWQWLEDDEFILIQFTGLKDKNGKDLDWWENDLLRKGSDHSCAPIGRIRYDEQKAEWVIVSRSGGEFCGLAPAYRNGWAKIGTIHENPELLK